MSTTHQPGGGSMRISQIVLDLIERVLPLPPVLPPQTPPTPPHLTDEALDDIQAAIKGIQAEQIEQMLALYGEVASGAADTEEPL
jgi:hypothetical protein